MWLQLQLLALLQPESSRVRANTPTSSPRHRPRTQMRTRRGSGSAQQVFGQRCDGQCTVLHRARACDSRQGKTPPRGSSSQQQPLFVQNIFSPTETHVAFPLAVMSPTALAVSREQSFIMIKPDGVHRALVGRIIERFEARGYKLVGIKV